MNNAEDDNLFSVRHPKRKPVSLTQKEVAIMRLADAYGMSGEGAAKLILLLRERKKREARRNS
jgi:predicted DNA-binding protein (UPF0251 family)